MMHSFMTRVLSLCVHYRTVVKRDMLGNIADPIQARWKPLKLKVSQVRSSQVKLVWETAQIQHKPGGNF